MPIGTCYLCKHFFTNYFADFNCIRIEEVTIDLDSNLSAIISTAIVFTNFILTTLIVKAFNNVAFIECNYT